MADVVPVFIPSLPDAWKVDAPTSSQSSRNITQALRLDGSLNLSALRQSVEFLITRYQALWNIPEKTRDDSGDVLAMKDFSTLPIDTRESEARRYIREQAAGLPDLNGGPLLRAALARLSASENILLISMHRSLSGAGVLISTVTRELSAPLGHHSAKLGIPLGAHSNSRGQIEGLLERVIFQANDWTRKNWAPGTSRSPLYSIVWCNSAASVFRWARSAAAASSSFGRCSANHTLNAAKA